MIRVKVVDQASKRLGDLAKKAKELEGNRPVPVTEFLTAEFVQVHTRFKDAEEMFSASGFQIESAEDFKAIPDDQWDAFVQSSSDFPSWDAMLGAAAKEWTRRKLGL